MSSSLSQKVEVGAVDRGDPSGQALAVAASHHLGERRDVADCGVQGCAAGSTTR
jgi:hypothetical protein